MLGLACPAADIPLECRLVERMEPDPRLPLTWAFIQPLSLGVRAHNVRMKTAPQLSCSGE